MENIGSRWRKLVASVVLTTKFRHPYRLSSFGTWSPPRTEHEVSGIGGTPTYNIARFKHATSRRSTERSCGAIAVGRDHAATDDIFFGTFVAFCTTVHTCSIGRNAASSSATADTFTFTSSYCIPANNATANILAYEEDGQSCCSSFPITHSCRNSVVDVSSYSAHNQSLFDEPYPISASLTAGTSNSATWSISGIYAKLFTIPGSSLFFILSCFYIYFPWFFFPLTAMKGFSSVVGSSWFRFCFLLEMCNYNSHS